MLILSNEEIQDLVTMEECMQVLEELYRDAGQGQTLNSPRVDSLVPCAHPGGYYAFKQMGGSWPRHRIQALRINSDIVTHPEVDGAPRRVKVPLAGGRWVGLVELFDTETGELLAIFPDGVAQRLRVGAANGLAARYMSRPDASRLGLIGSGWQAGAQLMAFAAARPLSEVRVYSKRGESRESFVQEWHGRLGVPLRAVDTPEECVRDAEIIAAATSSVVPVVNASWLREGVHVSCIKPQEIDAGVLNRCDRTVLHTKGQVKAHENIMPGTANVVVEKGEGWWRRPAIPWDRWTDLADLATGRSPGREGPVEITCFVNNVGMGLQFAAVGTLILRKARERGIGRELPGEWFTESVHP